MTAHTIGGFPRSIAVLVSLLILLGAALVAPAAVMADDPPPPLEPIDPQVVTQAADQDWDDYHPIPGSPYADNSIEPAVERWNVALVLADFPGTPFAVTQPQGSTIFGNPGPLAHDLPRESVPAFYRDWMNVPSAANQFQGMNRYWMEDSFGRYGVNLEAYGPYELPGSQDDYFITDFTTNTYCNTQTRTTTAQSGVTSVEVQSSASFPIGKIVTGLSGSRVILDKPDATHLVTGAATTMSGNAGASSFSVGSATGIAVGHVLQIGYSDRLETRTVTGLSGTTVTVNSPLSFSHAANTIVRDQNPTAINVSANSFVHSCNRNFRTDIVVAWADHVSTTERNSYDNSFYVSAGQDESGTWQEFGEMQFTQNTVPDAYGPPNPEIPQNWAGTRYIPWTSWVSAATIWPNASGTNSVEGEGSGMAVYAHELSHNLGLPDNYNNPYASPFQRTATGYWNMMSRGSFGGPGGTHTRWNIPSTMGTALGSMHVMRDKVALNFATAPNFIDLNRNALATSGLAVVEIIPREVEPTGSGQSAVRINLDGSSPQDKNVSCTTFTTTLAAAAAAGATNIKVASTSNIAVGIEIIVGDRGNDEFATVQAVGTAGAGGTGVTLSAPLTKAHASNERVSNRLTCSGTANFNNYFVEVVQQLGPDSFQPDNGVMITKTKNSSGSCGSFSCRVWTIDANPLDINLDDFTRPDNTIQEVTTGDPRQLADALFHAGTNSGSLYEWEDTRNALHFYVLDRTVDEDGVIRYKVAVQSTTGNGPHARGVNVANTAPAMLDANNGYCNFDLTNTGSLASFTNSHPEGAGAVPLVSNDVYRLSASATGAGWNAELPNALAYAGFGQTTSVPVYVTQADGADAVATISLTATSVSDPTKTATAECMIDNEAPTTTADLQPVAVNGFYHDPTVTLTADDGIGSGVALTEYDLDGSGWQAYTAPFQVTGDGDHTLLYRSTDVAGNVEDTNTLNFTIDTTAPVITIDAPVEAVTQAAGDPGNYPLGSEQIASYTCVDAISGATSCVGPVESGEAFDTSTVGFHTFEVTTDDLAGNADSASVQYNVYYGGMTGFLAPIQGGVNEAQANSAVPVKFGLGGDYGLGVIASGYPVSTPVNCTTLAPTGPSDAIQVTEPLSYQDGQYKIVWKTKKPWAGTCRLLEVKLVDNTVHTALFHFN